MLSVYKIKPAFQKLLMPLLKVLFKMKVTANQITIAAVFLSIGIGVSIVFSKDYPFLILLVPIGYLLRMTLNALDGMMATHYNMKSKLGEVLNELGDVISDSFIIFPLMVLPNVNPIVLLVFGVLAIINEFTGILAKVISQERRCDGPMGKSDFSKNTKQIIRMKTMKSRKSFVFNCSKYFTPDSYFNQSIANCNALFVTLTSGYTGAKMVLSPLAPIS